MTIKYLDSKRINALAADTKPTNVETNSILIEKDTAKRFWYDGSAWTWENDIGATRGVFAGANAGTVIDYITIATTGNATDFGDLSVARWQSGAVSSETRGVITAGATAGDVVSNVMDYITIATTGNAIDFGNLGAARNIGAPVSSPTRGIRMGGLQ